MTNHKSENKGLHQSNGLVLNKELTDSRALELNNRGFTLLELIISILILALIIPPLLNHFVVSMKITSEAKHTQNLTLLAQSLMEEIKGKDIEVISREFIYPEDGSLSFEAKPDGSGGYLKVQEGEYSCIRKEHTGPSGSFYEYSFIEKADKPYYFARKNVEYQGRSYDILITLDGTVYRGTDPGGNPVGYNTFPMPDIKNIDYNRDVVAVQSYEEDLGAAALFANHFAWCLAEEELHSEDPGYHITYHTLEEIRAKLSKTIRINLNSSGDDLLADILFEYTCSTYPGCGSILYTVASATIRDRKGDIYVFYNPSYQDEVILQKDPFLTEEINVHLYRQVRAPVTMSSETITIPAGVNLYSNVAYPGIPARPVRKTSAGNRIYSLRLQLFTAGADFAPAALCLELTSTK